MQGLPRYLSSAPVLATIWISLQAVGLIVFNYYFPDLLFHPLP